MVVRAAFFLTASTVNYPKSISLNLLRTPMTQNLKEFRLQHYSRFRHNSAINLGSFFIGR